MTWQLTSSQCSKKQNRSFRGILSISPPSHLKTLFLIFPIFPNFQIGKNICYFCRLYHYPKSHKRHATRQLEKTRPLRLSAKVCKSLHDLQTPSNHGHEKKSQRKGNKEFLGQLLWVIAWPVPSSGLAASPVALPTFDEFDEENNDSGEDGRKQCRKQQTMTERLPVNHKNKEKENKAHKTIGEKTIKVLVQTFHRTAPILIITANEITHTPLLVIGQTGPERRTKPRVIEHTKQQACEMGYGTANFGDNL